MLAWVPKVTTNEKADEPKRNIVNFAYDRRQDKECE